MAVWQTVTVFRLFRILWKLSYIKHVYIIRKNCKPKHEVTHVTLHLCWMGGGCHPHGWLHSQLNTWCKMIVGTRCSLGGKMLTRREKVFIDIFFFCLNKLNETLFVFKTENNLFIYLWKKIYFWTCIIPVYTSLIFQILHFWVWISSHSVSLMLIYQGF